MANRDIDGYKLRDCIVVCPECTAPFFTTRLEDAPLISSLDIVEADLHRVYPDPEIRASLLALCPICKYCTWIFGLETYQSDLADAPESSFVSPSKKFAMAVKSARAKNIHSLDVAYLALNGLWCAREAGESDEVWLELAAYEHQKGLQDHAARPQDDGLSHLMMGELWRQLKQFDAAVEEYKLALLDPTLHHEIAQHQIDLCSRQQFMPTALPARITTAIFPAAGYELTGYIPDTPTDENKEDNTNVLPVEAKTSVFVEDMHPEMLENLSDRLSEAPVAPSMAGKTVGQSLPTSTVQIQSSSVQISQFATTTQTAAASINTPVSKHAQGDNQVKALLQENIISFAAPGAEIAADLGNLDDDLDDDLDYAPPVEGGALPSFSIEDPDTASDILNNTEMVNDRSEVISKVENYLSLSRQLYKKSWIKRLGN